MRTEIQIDNGQNIIDIFFDDFASCLVIKKALAVNWPDCSGSVGEYYAISDYSIEERNFYTKTIDKVFSEGTDAEQIEIIKDFLNLFANGKYSINKFIAKINEIDFLASNQVAYSDIVPQNERFFGSFYPDYRGGSEPILFSITNDKIDPKRVEHYCQLIRKGLKPTVLTFEVYNLLSSEYSCKYVLDGHHKIEAYLKLKEDIPVINILKSEESTKRTAPLLHHAKTILKDFEYQHLFENNDENLLSIDFVNDTGLTNDLDKILKNSNRIDVSIINILKKYANAGNDVETSWLKNRLSNLKKNPNTSIFGLGKGLRVYEKKKDEKYGECWFTLTIKTNIQLNNWINETVK
jgi:hypothetical protein